jgi:predicted RNA-binding protein
MADTFDDAIYEMDHIKSSEFWASETQEGTWDVQLSNAVVVYGVSAPSVMEAVRLARWKVHLDKSFKSIAV